MKRLWLRYVDFWSEREAPDSLALLRITFALALLANLAEQVLCGNVLEYYAAPEHGGIFRVDPGSPSLAFLRLPWLYPTAAVVHGLLGFQALAALLLLVGLYSRFSAIVCLLIQMILFNRSANFVFGGDNVFRVFLYLMVLAPCGANWSLDARWRGKGRAEVPCWPRRLFIFQLTVVYVTTGIMKIGSTWSILGGWSALYLALNLPGIARWPGDWAAWVYPLTQVGTFVSKWWEITFFLVPLNMYLRRPRPEGAPRRGPLRRLLARWDLRWTYLYLGIAFHVSLIVLFDLGVFSVVMLSLYPCLLRPEEAQRVLEWGKRCLQWFGERHSPEASGSATPPSRPAG